MNNLLISNFKRLIKDKVLWLSIFIFIIMSCIMCFKQHQVGLNNNEPIPVENVLFWGEMLIGIVIAVFTSLYVGKDYSDGTIRNKLIIGHSRVNIYVANLITCIIAGIIINLAYIIPCLIFSLFWFSHCYLSISEIIYLGIDIIFMIISFSSIFNLIAMLFSNKTNGTVISILLAFFLFFIAAGVFSSLIQPKYVDNQIVTENELKTKRVENPNYLSGTKRKVYEILLDTIPSGQAMQYTIVKLDKVKSLYLNSSFIILFFNIIGLVSFCKKDLK